MRNVLSLIMCLVIFIAAHPVNKGLVPGDTASDFKLKNFDGRMISLSDYPDAKGFIVIFDCNTCPYSKAYNQRIIALNNKYISRGFPVITINANDGSGDSFDEMVRIAKKKKYTFPYLFDETQQVAIAYGATNTPHVFILTKELKVAYVGAIDDNARDAQAVGKHYVEDAIDALLAGKQVPLSKTKAIGCGIRWKNS